MRASCEVGARERDDAHTVRRYQCVTAHTLAEPKRAGRDWELNGTDVTGGGTVVPNPGPDWKALGIEGGAGQAESEILWQNTSSGQVSIWRMNGSDPVSGAPFEDNPGPSWKAIGTGDSSEILWQNADGQVSIWETNGNDVTGGGLVTAAGGTTPLNAGPNWKAVGTQNFRGRGLRSFSKQE
jgi:hypothetical protein